MLVVGHGMGKAELPCLSSEAVVQITLSWPPLHPVNISARGLLLVIVL